MKMKRKMNNEVNDYHHKQILYMVYRHVILSNPVSPGHLLHKHLLQHKVREPV